MGKGTWSGLVLAAGAACTAGACGGDTGILLDITMSSTLQDQLSTNGNDFDTLRIYVGQKTATTGVFTSAPDAYASVARTSESMDDGFRYLVEPDGELEAIGDMVFAAAVGDDLGTRLPFRVEGFAVSDPPLGFVSGEVRVVPLTLEPPAGVLTGLDAECIAWGTDGNQPGRITPPDDRDCDGAVGAADCDDTDPTRNQLDIDHDGVTSCDGDCLELPIASMPWLDPATVHPGADDTTADADTCDHVDHDCDGGCGLQRADTDQSGTGVCGKVQASSAVCQVIPADCDEATTGSNPDIEGAGEACNGRDDACDGFLPPAIPCITTASNGCRVGQVACDELRGSFAGQPDALTCSALPGGFSNLPAEAALCSTSYSASCLDSPDPVACGASSSQLLASACTVNATQAAGSDCVPDRSLLSLADTLLPTSCAWLVVGGVDQAEWQVGFVDPNSTGDTTPSAATTACRPTLAATSRVANPVARTVMLLLASPGNEQFPVRSVVLHLQPGGDPCSGLMACTTPGG